MWLSLAASAAAWLVPPGRPVPELPLDITACTCCHKTRWFQSLVRALAAGFISAFRMSKWLQDKTLGCSRRSDASRCVHQQQYYEVGRNLAVGAGADGGGAVHLQCLPQAVWQPLRLQHGGPMVSAHPRASVHACMHACHA